MDSKMNQLFFGFVIVLFCADLVPIAIESFNSGSWIKLLLTAGMLVTVSHKYLSDWRHKI